MFDLRLGARVIKTGLAVAVAIYIANLVNLQPVVMAAIAAAISIQPSITKMIDYLIEQLKANFIGASVALAVLMTFGNAPWIVGLTIILIILINLKLKYEKTITMSIVVVIAIMEIETTSNVETIEFAISRLALILIGISSAFVVNILFAPPNYEGNVVSKIKLINLKLMELIYLLRKENANKEYVKNEMKVLKDETDKLNNYRKLFREDEEKRFRKRKYSESKQYIVDERMYVLSKTNYKMVKKCFDIYLKKYQSHAYYEQVTELMHDNLKIQQQIFEIYEGKVEIKEKPEFVAGLDEKVYKLILVILSDDEIEQNEKRNYLSLLSMLNGSVNHAERAQKMLWNYKKVQKKVD